MNEVTLHPNVFATGDSKGLVQLLERVWVKEHKPGDGTFFVVSGYGNYNGGVRFFETFKNHRAKGGKLVAFFAGGANVKLTSKQVVTEMLECGADVHIINRKRPLHAKCYGTLSSQGHSLIVTSGNFTGPGMSQNVEMSVLLEPNTTASMKFSWDNFVKNILEQKWSYHRPTLADLKAPAWKLLYDEQAAGITLDETEEVTMVLTLSHSDTARINAAKGSDAGKGSQYFWLSIDCADFFPPLTVRNEKGHKATYSCIVTMDYPDLGITDNDCRVTFEAENNMDFRLGTGPLRYLGVAAEGDIAAISRLGENNYQMRIFRKNSAHYKALSPNAIYFIGHKGKQYGYLPNAEFEAVIGQRLRAKPN